MTETLFEHLHLTAWPFSIVPRPEHCSFLAGRSQLRTDINALLAGLSRRDTSSIHVLWSWFGAGKTHSLLYLATQASVTNNKSSFLLNPIYTEFPKRARGFLDLYQSSLLSIPSAALVEAFLEASTSPTWGDRSRSLSDANPDLFAALRTLVIGSSPDQAIALRWIRGENIAASDLRHAGISQKLVSPDQTVRTLAAIVQIFDMAARSSGRQGFRLIWMLDEFQRLERCSTSAAREINSSLHSLFNLCPTSLSLVISFSGPPDTKRLPNWLSPELKDRIGATKIMILPPFQSVEALEFVREVLSHFRTPGSSTADPYFPFNKQACEYVIDYLAKQTELRPRTIMHAMNAVLERGDAPIEAGSIKRIDEAFASETLQGYIIVAETQTDDDT